MAMKLGATIAALRKSKGMKQEQLAESLGVSSPAVSKWETDNSYPDITLLCPLARALGVNVDTLLSFEAELSDEQAMEKVNDVITVARKQGPEAGEKQLSSLLHQYPGSVPLKYYASTALTVFWMLFPGIGEEKIEKWKSQRVELLQYVRANGNSSYCQTAAAELAAFQMTKDELEQAEALLKELPERSVDTTMLWTQLYMRKGEMDKALEKVQKQLYALVNKVQACLVLLMTEKLQPDAAKALRIAEAYRKIEEIFRCGGGMNGGMFIELYNRLGEKEKMLESLTEFVDVITGPVQEPEPLLFAPNVQIKKEGAQFPMDICKLLLREIETEDTYKQYAGNPVFEAAREKLRAKIADAD